MAFIIVFNIIIVIILYLIRTKNYVNNNINYQNYVLKLFQEALVFFDKSASFDHEVNAAQKINEAI